MSISDHQPNHYICRHMDISQNIKLKQTGNLTFSKMIINNKIVNRQIFRKILFFQIYIFLYASQIKNIFKNVSICHLILKQFKIFPTQIF